jgi:hypothetical protein
LDLKVRKVDPVRADFTFTYFTSTDFIYFMTRDFAEAGTGSTFLTLEM